MTSTQSPPTASRHTEISATRLFHKKMFSNCWFFPERRKNEENELLLYLYPWNIFAISSNLPSQKMYSYWEIPKYRSFILVSCSSCPCTLRWMIAMIKVRKIPPMFVSHTGYFTDIRAYCETNGAPLYDLSENKCIITYLDFGILVVSDLSETIYLESLKFYFKIYGS